MLAKVLQKIENAIVKELLKTQIGLITLVVLKYIIVIPSSMSIYNTIKPQMWLKTYVDTLIWDTNHC